MRRVYAVLAAAMLSSTLVSSRAEAQPYPGDGGAYLIIGFTTIVLGGVTTSVGTQLRLADGEPSREWATLSYIASGANAVFAVGWLIAGAVDDDEPAFFALAAAQGSLAAASLVPAIITTAALPESDPGILGRERPVPTAFMPFQISGSF